MLYNAIEFIETRRSHICLIMHRSYTHLPLSSVARSLLSKRQPVSSLLPCARSLSSEIKATEIKATEIKGESSFRKDASIDSMLDIPLIMPDPNKSGTASPWAVFDSWGAGSDIFSNLDDKGE